MGCIFNLTLGLTGFSFCFAFNQSTEVSFRNCQDFPHPWVQTSPLWGPCGIGEDELGVLQVSTDPSLRQRVTSCPVKGRVTGFEKPGNRKYWRLQFIVTGFDWAIPTVPSPPPRNINSDPLAKLSLRVELPNKPRYLATFTQPSPSYCQLKAQMTWQRMR